MTPKSSRKKIHPKFSIDSPNIHSVINEGFEVDQILSNCSNTLFALDKKSKYVFTHDTGLMHIAAALKKEVFTIWGNTIPLFGMYPYKTKFTIFENNQISCRPCSKLGFSKCPKGHFKCMEDIKFDFYLQ